MRFIIQDKFLEHIPENNKQLLLKKLTVIGEELFNNKKRFIELPKGFWGRKIRGSKNIFKFRLNSGDRILFTYADQLENKRSSFDKTIVLLGYCKHDDQIRIARSKIFDDTKRLQYDFDINKAEYNEENLDVLLEKEYSNYCINLNSSISYVVDDTTYSNLFANSISKYFFYLNDVQYDCVKSSGPFLLSGSAGSGKTTVGLHKLMTANINQKICYITFTENLKKYSSEFFKLYNKNDISVDFFTINELCLNITKLDDKNLVNFEMFRTWRENSRFRYFRLKKFTAFELWAERREIIKGFIGINWMRNRKIC